jgi:hypothetical protein
MVSAIGLTGEGTTMKRKLKWAAVLVGVLLLGFGMALFLWPRDRITQAWKKIQIGMTEKEVEAILGRPGMSREESNFRVLGLLLQLAEPKDLMWTLDQTRTCRYWPSQGAWMQVDFDPRGYVRGKAVFRSFQPSFIGRLRDWLGW